MLARTFVQENAYIKNKERGSAGLNLTTSVCHAVKKEPGAGPGAVFAEADVVAGLNAEHGEQFHHTPGNRAGSGLPRWHHRQRLGGVTLTGRMSVHLRERGGGGGGVTGWFWADGASVMTQGPTCELQMEQYCLILPGCSLRSGKH